MAKPEVPKAEVPELPPIQGPMPGDSGASVMDGMTPDAQLEMLRGIEAQQAISSGAAIGARLERKAEGYPEFSPELTTGLGAPPPPLPTVGDALLQGTSKFRPSAYLPQLPPTIARNVSPKMGAQLQRMMLGGNTQRPEERDKIIALAKHINSSQLFAERLRNKGEAGQLAEKTQKRVEIAMNLLEAARDAYPDKGPKTKSVYIDDDWFSTEVLNKETRFVEPSRLSDFLDQAILHSEGVGADKKVRIELNRDMKTGKLVINIPKTFSTSLADHARELAEEQDVSLMHGSPEEIEAIYQVAKDRAGHDIIAHAMRARNLSFFDTGDVDVEEMAKSHLRGLKTFVKARDSGGGIFDAMTPTVEDLASEGPLDYFIRVASGLDYMAPKMKLIREKLMERGGGFSIADAYLYSKAAFIPFVGDITLEGLGITPEEEVEAYLEGQTWGEEGKFLHAELAAMVGRAMGKSDEEVEEVKRRDLASAMSLTLPMAAYLFEPDGVSVGLFGLGKGLKMRKAFKASSGIRQGAALLRKSARASETNLAAAIHELKKADPVLGRHAEIIIQAKQGAKTQTIDDLVAQLGKHRKAAEEAEELLRQKLPGVDVDDLAGLARAAKTNPDLVDAVKQTVEFRARSFGLAQAMAVTLGKRTQEVIKTIKAQQEAKAVVAAQKSKLDRSAAEIIVTMQKSEGFRNFVSTQNILLGLQGKLKVAMASGDATTVTKVAEQIKKTKTVLKQNRKLLTKEEAVQIAGFRKEAKANSRIYRKAYDSYHGDDALKLLQQEEKTVRGLMTQFGAEIGKAHEGLARASRRLVAADPRAAKALKAELKGSTIAPTAKHIIRASQKVVGDFVGKERKLALSLRAAEWRKHALSLADDYDEVAKVIGKVGADRGLIFARTGILGARLDEAREMMSGAVRFADEVYDPKTVLLQEKAAKGKRLVRVVNQTDPKIRLLAEVADDAPDLIKVTESAIKGEEGSAKAIHNLRALIEYAKRNRLGMDLSTHGADTLRSAGVAVDKNGKIGAEALRKLDIEEIAPRLQQNTSQVLLDGRGLRPKMEASFGREAVAHILEHTGDEGKLLARAMKADDPIAITIEQAERLQFDLADMLAKAEKLLDPKNRIEKLAAILLDAKAYHPTRRKNVIHGLSMWVRDVLRSHDPWLQKLGTSSEDVTKIVRGGDNLTEIAWDEFEQILKQAGKGQDSIRQATFRYLDTTSRILLPNSKTSVFNMGSKTIFQRAKRALLADSGRLKYQAAATLEAAARANNPALLGLSRVWLPSGVVAEEKAAARLYGEAIKNLKKSSSAEEFLDLQKTSTTKEIKAGLITENGKVLANLNVDHRIGRVFAFTTRSLIVGAAYDAVSTIAKKASLGLMSAEDALDIERILGTAGRAGGGVAEIKDVDRAFDTLHALGLSFMEKETQIGKAGMAAFGDVIVAQKQIVKYADDVSGEAIFGLNLARRGLDESMTRYIKSLSAHAVTEGNPLKKAAMKTYQKSTELWRTDAVSGLGMPNVGRPVLDFFGDATQLIFSNGFGFAARATFQNSMAAIPKLGPMLQDRMSKAARTGNNVQRTILETFFNPHIDDFWQGRAGALRIGKKGPLVSFDFLRQRAILDGIMDTRASTEVIDMAQKLVQNDPFFEKLTSSGTKLDSLIGGAKGWQNGINRWVLTMQQRQRIGTWLLHMSDGKSIGEASRLTREAIYDWRHGMSEAELLYSLRALPFIRWARVTSSQVWRGLMAPIIRPDLVKFSDMATGQTTFNRMRVMHRAQRDVLPHLYDARSPEQIAEEEGYYSAAARALYPDWIKKGMYPLMGITNVDQGDIERNVRDFGDEMHATNWAHIGPPNSILDMLSIWQGGANMFGAAFLALRGETSAATDLMYKSVETGTGMLYPAHREVVETMMGTSFSGGAVDLTAPSLLSPGEATFLRAFGGSPRKDPETGRDYTSHFAHKLILSTPGITMSVPRLINDWNYRNPAAGEDLTEQMMHLALNQTRMMRSYSYSVFEGHKRLQKKISQSAKAFEKKAKLVPGE